MLDIFSSNEIGLLKKNRNKIIYTLVVATTVLLLVWWINMPGYTNLENVTPDARMTSQEFLSEVYLKNTSISHSDILPFL